MSFRAAAITLALCAASAAAMSCMEAVTLYAGVDARCPKACSKDGDGMRECEVGEKERSPQSCNVADCRDFLSSLSDDTVQGMIAGLATCDGEMAAYQGVASMGEDHMKAFVLMPTAADCGLLDSLAASMPPANTCSGAFARTLGSIERACPKQCSEDGDEDDYLPCSEGQEERSPDFCGTDACANALMALDDDTYEQTQAGWAACASDPNLAGYAVYGSMMDGQYLRLVIRHWGEQCGKEDAVALSPIPPDTCMGAYLFVMGMDPLCPKQCDQEPEEDGLRECDEDEEERTGNTCGHADCQEHLAEMKASMDDIKTGLGTCTGDMAGLAAMAVGIEQMTSHVADQCSFSYDDLEVSEPPAPPPGSAPSPGGRRCVQISRQVIDGLADKGFTPLPCN